MSNSTKYMISAPIGGFGNHLRWLALLDKKFTLLGRFPVGWNKRLYDIIKGESWPNKFVEYDQLPQFIRDECEKENHFHLKYATFELNGSIDNRLKYMLAHPYATDRTWYNWLETEWKYRRIISERLIDFSHEIDQVVLANHKIAVTISPELAYRAYIKFNSTMNDTNKFHFLRIITRFNNKDMYDINVINGDALFAEVLDKNVYNQLIAAFNLDDNYVHACILHKRWYNLHKKAEAAIVRDMARLYNITEL